MRDALRESIRLRLRADVPVGVYLSGGLDSCSLLGMAASFHSGSLEAFTIAFEEGPFDEGPHRPGDGLARGRELQRLPHARGAARGPFRRRHLAIRDDHLQLEFRGEVPAQPAGARRRLQGGADRRGLGRDPGGVSVLPPGHADVQRPGGGRADEAGPRRRAARGEPPSGRLRRGGGRVALHRGRAARARLRAHLHRQPRGRRQAHAGHCSRRASPPSSPGAIPTRCS